LRGSPSEICNVVGFGFRPLIGDPYSIDLATFLGISILQITFAILRIFRRAGAMVIEIEKARGKWGTTGPLHTLPQGLSLVTPFAAGPQGPEPNRIMSGYQYPARD
jgi:hypothetical protein